MKKIFLSFAVLAMSMAMFTSCSDDDNENVKRLDFEGGQWASLIDNPQYGGTLLYGDGVIKSMDVSPTTYQLGVTKNGDTSGSKALTEEGDFLTLTITGYKGEVATGTVNVDMAKDGKFLETWKTVDLSSLGEVTKLGFTMDGSDKSAYGVKQPKYFAFDNVVVKF